MSAQAATAKVQEQINATRQNLEKSLHDQSKPWTAVLDMVEAKTNVPRIYIFLGAAGFCALYLIFGYGAQLLCNLIGVMYPAYISIHAIESSTKLDDTRWLTYWVTYGILSIFEFFSGVLVSIVPFYWLMKCCFLIWCMMPIENNGSNVIYLRVVRPYFLKHHQAADEFIGNVMDNAKKTVGGLIKND